MGTGLLVTVVGLVCLRLGCFGVVGFGVVRLGVVCFGLVWVAGLVVVVAGDVGGDVAPVTGPVVSVGDVVAVVEPGSVGLVGVVPSSATQSYWSVVRAPWSWLSCAGVPTGNVTVNW